MDWSRGTHRQQHGSETKWMGKRACRFKILCDDTTHARFHTRVRLKRWDGRFAESMALMAGVDQRVIQIQGLRAERQEREKKESWLDREVELQGIPIPAALDATGPESHVPPFSLASHWGKWLQCEMEESCGGVAGWGAPTRVQSWVTERTLHGACSGGPLASYIHTFFAAEGIAPNWSGVSSGLHDVIGQRPLSEGETHCRIEARGCAHGISLGRGHEKGKEIHSCTRNKETICGTRRRRGTLIDKVPR